MTQEAKNDWVGNAKKRAAFWATTGELGLADEEVREALGLVTGEGDLVSTTEYEGTLDDAMAAIAEYADKKRRRERALAFEAQAGVGTSTIFSQALTKQGWELNFVCRGLTRDDALDEFGAMVRTLTQYGAQPLVNSRWEHVISPPADESPAPQPPRAQPHQAPNYHQYQDPPQAAAGPAQQTGAQWPGYTKVQTSVLKQIEVRPDGTVCFEVGALKYPLKDARGADVVADLFDEGCFDQQFYPALLSQPGFYRPPGLVVTFGKSERGYWDTLRVSRA